MVCFGDKRGQDKHEFQEGLRVACIISSGKCFFNGQFEHIEFGLVRLEEFVTEFR